MKVLITGGHLTPAVSLISRLPREVEVVYVGRKFALEGDKSFSLEFQAITGRKIPFINLSTGRLQRNFTKYTILSLLKVPFGFWQSMQILQKNKPNVILSFGGYISIPICFVGFLLRIPIVVHEQTFECGLANRLVALIATKICVSWESSQVFFPRKKTVVTGNPLLDSIMEQKSRIVKKSIGARPVICVTGGSVGSHAINMFIEQSLTKLLERYTVIHQTGDAKEFNDFDRLEALRKTLPKELQANYTIVRFFDPQNMVAFYDNADVVVARGGMNTILTLLVLQKPSLLIPLLTSQQNEQHKNALFLKQYGLATVLDQNKTTPESFFDTLVTVIENKHRYQSSNYAQTIPKEASKKIIDILFDIHKTYSAKKSKEIS